MNGLLSNRRLPWRQHFGPLGPVNNHSGVWMNQQAKQSTPKKLLASLS
jgi:hypothetical protein